MHRRFVSDLNRLGPIDYSLMGLGTALVAYSAGMAVGQQSVGVLCAGLVLAGTVVGYIFRLLLGNSKFVSLDGFLYVFAAIAAIFLFPVLNSFLPEGGFPRELATAAVLTWMLIFGSCLTWSDGTLLFQAVPTIALFGLIGCYDTYRDVPIMFFGFLVCLATVFARSQARERLRQAVQSGYFGEDLHDAEASGLFERIKNGPWRWMAGPEWALASALVVVTVSFLGAPVIQETVKPISGLVAVVTPRSVARNISRFQASGSAEASGAVKVGRGPISLDSTRTLFEVKLDRPRYLHTAYFYTYNSTGWKGGDFTTPSSNPLNESSAAFALDQIKHPREFEFSIRADIPTMLLPVPGEVVGISGSAPIQPLPDGTLRVNPASTLDIDGKSWEPNPGTRPTKALTDLPSWMSDTLDTSVATPRVRELALDITKGTNDDFQKARQILLEIAARTKYNAKAGAVPDGRDAVDYFLFDSKEGYCDLFASSMVVMARCAGIPARYVTGYLPDPSRTDFKGNSMIVAADGHAWAELLFKDEGWVVFDPTTMAEAVPGGELGSGESQPWYKQDWFLELLNALIGCALVAGVWFGSRMFRQRRGSRPERHELERAYIEFVSALQKGTGARRMPSQTPEEYLEIVRPSLNGQYETAQQLTREFETALYSAEAPSLESVAKIRERVRGLRRAMAKRPKS